MFYLFLRERERERERAHAQVGEEPKERDRGSEVGSVLIAAAQCGARTHKL